MNVEKFIKQLKESESYKKFTDEMNEISTTAGVDGYQTPKAFSPQSGEGKAEFDAQTKDNAEQYGYKIVPKSKRKHSITYKQYATQESVYKQMMSSLQESSYKEYKGDKHFYQGVESISYESRTCCWSCSSSKNRNGSRPKITLEKFTLTTHKDWRTLKQNW